MPRDRWSGLELDYTHEARCDSGSSYPGQNALEMHADCSCDRESFPWRTSARSASAGPLHLPAVRPLPNVLSALRSRAAERQTLSMLSDHILRGIGLTRADVDRASSGFRPTPPDHGSPGSESRSSGHRSPDRRAGHRFLHRRAVLAQPCTPPPGGRAIRRATWVGVMSAV
jgi:uncharacterized protein YjiS (DUF1127 family)